jgi:flagellar basal body rod protein FlgG
VLKSDKWWPDSPSLRNTHFDDCGLPNFTNSITVPPEWARIVPFESENSPHDLPGERVAEENFAVADIRQKELTMAGVRSNGFAVFSVAVAFVVCYFAIDRQLDRTGRTATVPTKAHGALEFNLELNPPPELIHELDCQGLQPATEVSRYSKVLPILQRLSAEIEEIKDHTGNPPTPVPAPDYALPVDPQHDETDDDEVANAAVRSVIERELAHTSREERDIWFDELKSLPAGVVRDLLQVRKQLRQLPRLTGGAPEKIASVEVPPPRPREIQAEPASQRIRFQLPEDFSTSSAIELAVSQLRHNLMNAATPGFKRLRVTLIDSYLESSPSQSFNPTVGGSGIQGQGCRVAPIQLDLKQGTLKSTGRQLDLAIEGDGFFLFRQGDKELLTRCGALSLDRDRQLCLAIADASVLLHPIIKIPEDYREIEVSANGTVNILRSSDATLTAIGQIPLGRVASPARLQPVGGTMFMATDESGPVTIGVAMAEGLGELQQGFLEQSNVDFQAELDEIEELTMILKALPPANSRPMTASGPQQSPAR